jgi:hypothetical protein
MRLIFVISNPVLTYLSTVGKGISVRSKMRIVRWLDGRIYPSGCLLPSFPSHPFGWVDCSQALLYLSRQSIVVEILRCTCYRRASRVRGLRPAAKGSFFGLGSTGVHWCVLPLYASGWILIGIYLSLVVRHWDGNGHGTFSPGLCCARSAHSSHRRDFSEHVSGWYL